jgi:cellulose synthase operon protein C
MRLRTALSLFIAAFALSSAEPADAQFNPQGRKKPRPGAKPPAAARPPGARPPAGAAPKPARPSTPGAAEKPEAEGKTPGSEALIARYTGIVMAQPGAPFPLQRLSELYRERDGKLDALIADFEKRAAQPGPSQWNALVALAGIFRQDGRHEQAITTYERAIAQQPKSPIALMALAQLLTDRGDKAGARKRFEQALPLITVDADREQVLRTVLGLALDLKDFDGARAHHRDLVNRAKGSFFVRAELGRELLARNEYQRAVDEYKAVVKAAAGDNRVLAPALRDLGRALSKVGKREEALKELHRALDLAGGQSGVRREIFDIIVEVYRADDKVRELIATLEKENSQDPDRLRMLGGLYEETGQVDKALVIYKRVLGRDAKDIATRLKVVQLLQIQGELDQAIREYEALIRAAPHNPDFVFQLAEALIQRGDRAKALDQLKKLEARSGNDEETLAALVDFYERVQEKDRALAVLQRLAQVGSQDPRHLVELGDRQWQEGDKKKAVQTWQRIRTVVADKAKAAHTLGEVYLEHDMPREALDAFREAMKLAPTKQNYRKAYALALERTGASASDVNSRHRQYEEARRIWEELLRASADNPHLAREARQHIVTLWSLSGQLQQRVGPLERRLKMTPPDLESGRLLAEVQIRLRRPADAEVTLKRIVQAAPGDAMSLGSLERVLGQQRKLREAISVLEKLVQADPKRAREYYQRMAQYAAELYQDDDAVRYAARAVELSPDDADGHKKLGEMYRRRQDTERAISAFRKAISKNDRLFPVYFQLAELLLSTGEIDEADRLLRRVVRAAQDEELVAQAARLSMQINLGRGTLESLEKELLPVALGNPTKPLYRRLLVEIYGALAFPLVHQKKSHDPAEATKAVTALARIGERAVKPLLDALGDERDTQQRIALELLAHIENKSAGPALFAYAQGNALPELRARAMIAVGALRDPALLPKLTELLAPGGEARADESDPISVAAAWGVARMRSPKARDLMARLLESEAPSIRALSAIGLGLLKDRKARVQLAQVARAPDAGPLPRAAAAFALGELGDHSALGSLIELTDHGDPSVRAAAVIALARLSPRDAERAVADALVSTEQQLVTAATAAALVSATGTYRGLFHAFDVPDGRVDVRSVIDALVPAGYTADESARAMEQMAPALARASVAAVQSSPERARFVADSLLARDGKPSFGPLTRELDKATPEARTKAERAAESIAAAVVPPFIALASHPSPEVRALSVQFLATRPEASASEQLVAALEDRDERVQRAALTALRGGRSLHAIEAVTRLLGGRGDWPVRLRAAQALGELAKGSRDAKAVAALSRAARSDSYALVREASVEALVKVDSAAARSVLEQVIKGDPEPRVRKSAQAVLSQKP